MGYIPKKTLEDLEYVEVLKRCSYFSITSLGKVEIMNLHPKTQTHEIIKGLSEVSEFRASFDNENRIPNHGFESMLDMFSLLKIENSVLEISSFRNNPVFSCLPWPILIGGRLLGCHVQSLSKQRLLR